MGDWITLRTRWREAMKVSSSDVAKKRTTKPAVTLRMNMEPEGALNKASELPPPVRPERPAPLPDWIMTTRITSRQTRT